MSGHPQQFHPLAGIRAVWKARFKAAGLEFDIDEILDVARVSPTITTAKAFEVVYRRKLWDLHHIKWPNGSMTVVVDTPWQQEEE